MDEGVLAGLVGAPIQAGATVTSSAPTALATPVANHTITYLEVPPEPCRVIADFDGDGIVPTVGDDVIHLPLTSPAVSRPSMGGWYRYSGGPVFDGLATDIDVVLPPAMYDRIF